MVTINNDRLKSLEEKIDKIVIMMEAENKNALERYQDLSSKLEKVELRTTVAETRLDKVEQSAVKTNDVIKDLEAEVNQLKQEKLSNNMIIQGIVERGENENDLKLLINKILLMLTGDVSTNDMVFFCRLGTHRNGSTRSILIKFKLEEIKARVLKQKKKISLNCAMFDGPESSNDQSKWGAATDLIYFGDHMTPASKKMFNEAKKLRTENQVKFVWTTNGTTYVRGDEGQPAQRIYSETDLERTLRRSARRKLMSPDKQLPDPKR